MSDDEIPTGVCKFGPVEYDGARYCHEHGSFQERWHQNRSYCPRALPPVPRCRRDCPDGECYCGEE